MRIITEYFFTFVIYSVCGWIVETLLYVIRDKKVVKRGFLFGPLCPIYGTGAVICTLLLYGKINNIFLLFLCGALLCGSLEYLTHFAMEKLFHAMWWDYSNRRFNIKGRVYLNGLIFFGAGVVLIVKVFQPLVYKLLDIIPNSVLYSICFVVYTLVLIDVTATVADLKKFMVGLKHLQNLLIEKGQLTVDNTEKARQNAINEIKENEKVSAMIQRFKDDNALIKRIHKKYPNFTLEKYKTLLDIIKDAPQEGKGRADIKLYGTADSIPGADDEEKD